MTTIPVHNVAKFIIQSQIEVSNLKLQKLLYYVQGWHLGLYKTPIFTEDIQAWVHGPVVPRVFSMYKHFRWNPIDKPVDAVVLPNPVANHVMDVLAAYGKLSASQLERLSHTESPWKSARGNLAPDEPSHAVITHGSMRDFFASRAKAS